MGSRNVYNLALQIIITAEKVESRVKKSANLLRMIREKELNAALVLSGFSFSSPSYPVCAVYFFSLREYINLRLICGIQSSRSNKKAAPRLRKGVQESKTILEPLRKKKKSSGRPIRNLQLSHKMSAMVAFSLFL